MIRKISYIVLLYMFFKNHIVYSQYRDGKALISICDLKEVELKNFVYLQYTNKNGYYISFLVPKNKVAEIKKISKNDDLFLNNILSMDSVYYNQYWFLHLISELEYADIDKLISHSEIGKYNYSNYKLNYDSYRKRGKRIELVSSEKINKRITIYESNCSQFFTGYINNDYITHYHNNISIDYINIDLKNVMIPFVFPNYIKCQ